MSIDIAEINLRPERLDDELFLLEVYSNTRTEELDATGWPQEMRAAFLKMQFNAQRQGYRGAYPHAAFDIIQLRGERVGRMVVNRTAEEIELVDIALLPANRNQGIGTALIRKLLSEAAGGKKPLRLMVIRGQRAHGLYQRLGFRKIGEMEWRDEMEWRSGV